MMSVKRVQKFRTDDMSIPRSGSAFDWLKQTFSQSDLSYPDLGNERSPVWNFCPHFPDVILQGNQSWPGEMLLFSQAVIRKGGNDYMIVFLTVSITYLGNSVTSLLRPLFSAGCTFPYKKKPHYCGNLLIWPVAHFEIPNNGISYNSTPLIRPLVRNLKKFHFSNCM